jgi:hypothetical protein
VHLLVVLQLLNFADVARDVPEIAQMARRPQCGGVVCTR